ncbi:MAG: hypothetical protein GY858_00925 [Candidatus Omnitrophica bacterium]|nr:hypothetical protein [Candidatus Omnitrophota bacterium]
MSKKKKVVISIAVIAIATVLAYAFLVFRSYQMTGTYLKAGIPLHVEREKMSEEELKHLQVCYDALMQRDSDTLNKMFGFSPEELEVVLKMNNTDNADKGRRKLVLSLNNVGDNDIFLMPIKLTRLDLPMKVSEDREMTFALDFESWDITYIKYLKPGQEYSISFEMKDSCHPNTSFAFSLSLGSVDMHLVDGVLRSKSTVNKRIECTLDELSSGGGVLVPNI